MPLAPASAGPAAAAPTQAEFLACCVKTGVPSRFTLAAPGRHTLHSWAAPGPDSALRVLPARLRRFPTVTAQPAFSPHDGVILLRSPRPFVHVGVEHLLPAVQALHIATVRKVLGCSGGSSGVRTSGRPRRGHAGGGGGPRCGRGSAAPSGFTPIAQMQHTGCIGNDPRGACDQLAAAAHEGQDAASFFTHQSSSSSWLHTEPPCGATGHPEIRGRQPRHASVRAAGPLTLLSQQPGRRRFVLPSTADFQFAVLPGRGAHLLLAPAPASISPHFGLHLAAKESETRTAAAGCQPLRAV